ncbi:MAG TPA: membrane protein insertase YidC, partial [Bacteroidia bacterium]|nr:membrane protein insertase YidC [Bacteroidia bacterium]
MDRKSIIGFVLIAVILTVWMTINSNNNAKEAAILKHTQDSLAKVDSQKRVIDAAIKKHIDDSVLKAVVSKDTTLNIDSVIAAKHDQTLGVFKTASKGENKPIVIQNEKLKATIYPKGGRIGEVELKGVKTSGGKPLILFRNDSTHFGLAFFDKQRRRFNTDSLYFNTTGKEFTVSGNDSNSIALRLYADSSTEKNPRYIEYLYSLRGNSYMLGCTISFVGFDQIVPNDQSYFDLNWRMNTPTQEKNIDNERAVASVFYNFDGEEGIENLTERGNDSKSLSTGEVKWVSFKQQYFSSILIANSKFSAGTELSVRTPTDPFVVKAMSTTLSVPFGRTAKETFPMRFYFGP